MKEILKDLDFCLIHSCDDCYKLLQSVMDRLKKIDEYESCTNCKNLGKECDINDKEGACEYHVRKK